ncbi:MAG: GNAT family acetyltransferase [Thiolinea sp.]
MNLLIRNYRDSDRAALIQLWQQVFPNDPPHNEPGKVLAEKLAVDDLIFVAEQDGQLCAACMAGYDGHRGWLYAVAVAAEYRRQGVGRQLIEQVLQTLAERGCGKVNLQIRADNTAVAAFYRELGFAVEERMSMGRFVQAD